jgi:hypothetical protein
MFFPFKLKWYWYLLAITIIIYIIMHYFVEFDEELNIENLKVKDFVKNMI